MLDHVSIKVSNFKKSRPFYQQLLSSIGYELLMEFSSEDSAHGAVIGFGENGKPDFWLSEGVPNYPPVHIAFGLNTHALVDSFHQTGLKAGGKNNSFPGIRLQHLSHYYSASILDPDGHNIEAVCHLPDTVEETSEESFPASDPPAWTPVTGEN